MSESNLEGMTEEDEVGGEEQFEENVPTMPSTPATDDAITPTMTPAAATPVTPDTAGTQGEGSCTPANYASSPICSYTSPCSHASPLCSQTSPCSRCSPICTRNSPSNVSGRMRGSCSGSTGVRSGTSTVSPNAVATQEAFKQLQVKIDKQRRYINDLKALIIDKNKEYPKSSCEQKELMCLEEKLAEEICKLNKMSGDYLSSFAGGNAIFTTEIPLATSLDEDAAPKLVSLGNYGQGCAEAHGGQSCANYNPQVDCVKLVMRSVNEEMNKLQRENQILLEAVQTGGKRPPICPTCTSTPGKNPAANELKKQYTLLLQDYSKKEVECLDLKNQIKKKLACEKTDDEKRDELELFKLRCDDLLAEQHELRILINEQASHLDEYRHKYLASLQKIEEQKCELNCMEITNTKVEEQINCHIHNIKLKCEEKLKEFVNLPALLEEEQNKLKEVLEIKECLEAKLRDIVEELDMTKAQLNELGGSKNRMADLEDQLRDTKEELECITDKFLQLKNDRELLNCELNDTKEELCCLRSESANIIGRTRDRNELNRKIMQEHIDKLEADLAQTRAAACLTALNREETIREMKEKINVLANSFDGAQMHIQNLRNQISFFCNLQNIQSFPAPCSMNNGRDG